MSASWSMDDVAAAQQELDARAEGRVTLGSDVDLLLGPDLSSGHARHKPVNLKGSKQSRAAVREQERARARREVFRQNQGVGPPPSRWPGKPGSWVGVGWLMVWGLCVVVELSAGAVVRVAEPRVASGESRGWVGVGLVGWGVAGVVLAGMLGGGAAVVGAAAVWAVWMGMRPKKRR